MSGRPIDLARQLAESDIESVAIVFLHSYRNPDHERRMAGILADTAPRLYVTPSYESHVSIGSSSALRPSP